MEETPSFVMRCPKCGKNFPFDQTYCEVCSVMLEPFETGPQPSEDTERETPVTDEKIEDVKIDSLRVDIENKFVYTLLFEIDRLKKRLARKEKSLAGMQEKEPPGNPELFAAGRVEASIDGIMKKITKLEMTLDNLEVKFRGDISALGKELEKLEKPGLFGIMSEKGRYFRMLSSELRTKKLILDVIQGKRSPAALRFMDMLRPIVLVPVITAAAIISALLINMYLHGISGGPWSVFRSNTSEGSRPIISERDIDSLLNDIRTANLKKDLNLWRSRYSRSYLSSREKKENIVEQWEKVDYKSLAYRVKDLRISPDGASATILWEIDFSPRKSTAVKKITQRLRADFAIEDGRLKITSVAKEEFQ